MNSIHILISYFFKIHINIIFHHTLKSPKQSLLSGFQTKILYIFLTSLMRDLGPVPCPTRPFILSQ